MRSTVRALLLTSAAALAVACADDPATTPDSGTTVVDGEVYDSGVIDTGTRDSGPSTDSGRPDGGFRDPNIRRAGVERVHVRSAVRPTVTTTLSIYVEVFGTGTSTLPALFVAARGPGTSHEYLPDHLEFLHPGRHVVYYDIRGAGLSSYGDGTSNSTITVAQHVLDLAGLVDHIGALPDGIDTRQVDLVGHGYGALLAMRYASDNPTRVRQLVLMNPYPLTIEQYISMRGEIEARIGSVDRERLYLIVNRPECYGNDVQCYLQAWAIIGRYTMCAPNRDRFGELEFTTGSFRNEYLFIFQDLRSRSYDDRAFLAGVRAQTTVVSGPCEPTPAAAAEGYATIPGARHVVLPNTGEFGMVEETAAFQATVRHALFRP